MAGNSRSFRGRCASALTHPATVAAVVVLLVNDALFKSLWPESWVTGKLSDLAWVVFASPLLAFVLSFFVGRRPFTGRAVVLVSYVGLPALYAAFNTFEPIHDRILWGLSLVAGGTAGSPLDPSDSLVIPFGLGIAVWVWRRRPVGPDRLRVRLALLAAGVATFATVATTYAPRSPQTGIHSVGIAENGLIVVSASNQEVGFRSTSDDGGLTWATAYHGPNVNWGGSEVETPRGTFLIQASDILMRTSEGEWEVIYSAAYLQQEANVWIQERTTTRFGFREIARRPLSITYDQRSENLIVGMGLQGILVGTPDGRWSRVAVGQYVPTDFSVKGKALALFSNLSLLVTTICLSISMLAISLALVNFQTETLPLGIGMAVATLALWIVSPVLVMGPLGIEAFAIALAVLSIGTIGLAIRLALVSERSTLARGFAFATGIISAMATVVVLLAFGLPGALTIPIVSFVIPAAAILFGITAIAISWRQLRYRQTVAKGFAGMNILVILVFLMWVQLDYGLTFAKISAFLLVALVGVVLTRHLRREQHPS